jgi:ABC-type enterochelin transport system substrate-binding protein
MAQTRHTILVLLALATALALVGCGGSSSSQTTAGATQTATQATDVTVPTGAPLAHSVFAAKASAICARLYRAQASLKGARVRNNADLKRIAVGLKANEGRAVVELSALAPPASLAREWRQVLSDARTLTSEIGAMFVKFEEEGINSSAAAKLNAEVAALTARAHAIARRARLGECARGI